jgi:predicted esterase
MFLEGMGVARARVAAVVWTGLGLLAMACAPLARSAAMGDPAGAPPARPAPVAALSAATQVAVEQPRDAPGPQVASEAPSIPARTVPKEPRWIEGDGSTALVFPPRAPAASPQPVTVFLHGMCGHPQNACAPFVDVSTARGWLVCPRAEDECGTGSKWRIVGKADTQVVEASVDALGKENAGDVEGGSSRILVGFSLGGIAAMQIVERAPAGTYAGLVVIAAQIQPDAGTLKRAGVHRVVFAAGDLDMTSAQLRADARNLDTHGVPARFVSLGRVGHGYPVDMEERMREGMEWVTGT